MIIIQSTNSNTFYFKWVFSSLFVLFFTVRNILEINEDWSIENLYSNKGIRVLRSFLEMLTFERDFTSV